jgi:elongation factor Ts
MDTAKVESERVLLREKALAEGKPEKMVDKIVDGQIGKFYSENVLLEQKFVKKDDKKTIEQIQRRSWRSSARTSRSAASSRYELGEGLEKKNEDFAAEVAAQVAAAKAD